MRLEKTTYLLVIFISSFFCADILAVTWQTKLAVLPGISVRKRQVEFGKGEAGRAFADYNVIPRRNLFGLNKPAAPAPVKKSAPVNTPKKSASVKAPIRPKKSAPPKPVAPPLRLKLKGTIDGAPRWARAILEDLQTKEELLLKIGDVVQGAKLVEIKLGEVILTRQNNRLSLKLGEDGKLNSIARANNKTNRQVKPPVPSSRHRKPSPIELNVPEKVEAAKAKLETALEREGLGAQIDEWNWELDRQAIVNRLNNLGELVNQASVLPYFDQGVVTGFRISNIAPESLFVNLGAQDGDIIQEVNGIPLTSVNQVMSLYSELQVAPELRVRVKRGESYHFLVYDLQ